ncbi:MAG: hypothetical protein H7Y38_17145, partial [Armatimonadetes bacterium]|nr:hypothetical protein [Armatimonadota bacterium]
MSWDDVSPDLLKKVRDYAAQTGKTPEEIAQMALFRFVSEPYREPTQRETDEARARLNAQWSKDIAAFDTMSAGAKASDERAVRVLVDALHRERSPVSKANSPVPDGLPMKRIVLDAQPLALLSSPQKTVETLAIRSWLRKMDAAGHVVYVPEVADYEVRRELLRSEKSENIVCLDLMKLRARYMPTNTRAMLCTAELWAQVRSVNEPAPLDIDVFLAAQILTLAATYGLPVSDFVIATTNAG